MTPFIRPLLLACALLCSAGASAEAPPEPSAGIDLPESERQTTSSFVDAMLTADTVPEVEAKDINWQQWEAAGASARAIVDAPVASWGLLPDPEPDNYPPLPLLDLPTAGNRYGAAAPWLIQGEPYRIDTLALGRQQVGEASWYGNPFHGRRTASGEVFDMNQLTAAHRTLPLPSYIRVTHLGTDQSVIVKINDRGPFHSNRIIDLSWAAARKLGIHGTARVRIAPVEQGRTGHHRAGEELPDETVYRVLIGNFADSDQAHALQSRLMSRLPAGVPVTLHRTPGPLSVERVEIGPLLSTLEANLLIRSIRATRVGLLVETPRLRVRSTP